MGSRNQTLDQVLLPHVGGSHYAPSMSTNTNALGKKNIALKSPVVRPEVMTPFRNTMCFVYSKQRNSSSASQALQAPHYPAGPLIHPFIKTRCLFHR